MTDNVIVIGSDHAGYSLKQVLVAHLEEKGWRIVDVGTNGAASVDYPDFGAAVAHALKEGKAPRGIVVCGTGIGISIAANRHDWIRAGLCHDITSARLCRLHNDANVLALGARLIGEEVAKDCVDVFLATEFEGGRHQRRVDKLGFAESM
ncbi:ribose 5-phosphate isomerase B [Nisaea denitrificans]|uniref:ribose 5-phosphate isomerase B n=1 Tax=Nisaea denitrificans TaxID=390877 RepID=UPI000425D5DD|nr:ribose 5-phosphate isomerase B [Nisaea denitrificans]